MASLPLPTLAPGPLHTADWEGVAHICAAALFLLLSSAGDWHYTSCLLVKGLGFCGGTCVAQLEVDGHPPDEVKWLVSANRV